MPDPKPAKQRYVFTLGNVTLSTEPVGETPTGYRLDIQYQSGTGMTLAVPYYDDWVAPNAADVLAGLKQDASSGLSDPEAFVSRFPCDDLDEAAKQVAHANNGQTPEALREAIKAAVARVIGPPAPDIAAFNPVDKHVIVHAIRNVRQNDPSPGSPPVALGPLSGWYGLDAELLSGSDWAIVRSDGRRGIQRACHAPLE
jgi:hypothetical protein